MYFSFQWKYLFETQNSTWATKGPKIFCENKGTSDNLKVVLTPAWNHKARLHTYRISSYSFRGNYSFLNLEIQRSQYIRPKVTVHKGAETIQGRKLFKGGNYMGKYGKSVDWYVFRTLALCEFNKKGTHKE